MIAFRLHSLLRCSDAFTLSILFHATPAAAIRDARADAFRQPLFADAAY